MVKEIVELGAELEIARLLHHEFFAQRQIELRKIGSMEGISGQVTERPGSGYGECSRIEVGQPAVLNDRIHTGNEIGTPNIPAVTATGYVNDCRSEHCSVGADDWSGK